jgi:hypothetical protein
MLLKFSKIDIYNSSVIKREINDVELVHTHIELQILIQLCHFLRIGFPCHRRRWARSTIPRHRELLSSDLLVLPRYDVDSPYLDEVFEIEHTVRHHSFFAWEVSESWWHEEGTLPNSDNSDTAQSDGGMYVRTPEECCRRFDTPVPRRSPWLIKPIIIHAHQNIKCDKLSYAWY